jgi:tryptophan synthase beta subunit
MLKNNNNIQEPKNLVLVPLEMLDEIKQLISDLKSNKNESSEKPQVLGEFISEKDARNLIGRKTTWFYEQRRSGKLPYSKVGSKVYYKRDDLFNLLTNN